MGVPSYRSSPATILGLTSSKSVACNSSVTLRLEAQLRAHGKSEVRLLSLLLATTLVLNSAPTFPPDLSPELNNLIERYVNAAQKQRDAMLGAQVEMEIDGRFTNLKESGRMRVLRSISKVGELGTKMLDFNGDNRVKSQLISRFLEEEQKSKAYGAMAITPQNYDFDIKAVVTHDAKKTYVFDVKPKKKNMGSFRGELWIDGATGMPLREAGQFVKSPSVFLTNLRFARDYELLDGISVVKHFQSSTDVRLLGIGRAEINIDFSNFSRSAPDASAHAE